MLEQHEIEVSVDRSLCIGNGVCVALAPLAFVLDDSLKATVTDPQSESEDDLLEAARNCPTQAIYLSARHRPVYP